MSVYCKMKPDKWGSKTFTLCDATNSYCLDLFIYYCSAFTEFYKQKYNDLFKPSNTKHMLRNYLNINHSLFIDNYYNSVSLSNYLIDKEVYVTGTLNLCKKDKMNVNSLLDIEEKKEEYWYFENEKMNIVRIVNNTKKKKVYLSSTKFYEEIYTLDKKIPSSLDKYNNMKGGVDIMNRMISNYRNNHGTYKWWKPIFLEILDISIINSYFIYNLAYNFNKNMQIEHKEFRLKLVEELESFFERPKRGPKKINSLI